MFRVLVCLGFGKFGVLVLRVLEFGVVFGVWGLATVWGDIGSSQALRA